MINNTSGLFFVSQRGKKSIILQFFGGGTVKLKSTQVEKFHLNTCDISHRIPNE